VLLRMIGRAQGNDMINEGRETPQLARAYGLLGGPWCRRGQHTLWMRWVERPHTAPDR
jgi:hypothetical protein